MELLNKSSDKIVTVLREGQKTQYNVVTVTTTH